jgi:hypothetical protein
MLDNCWRFVVLLHHVPRAVYVQCRVCKTGAPGSIGRERGFPQSCKSLCCFPRRERVRVFFVGVNGLRECVAMPILGATLGTLSAPHSLLSHPNSILSDKKEGCVCLPQLTVSFVPTIPRPSFALCTTMHFDTVGVKHGYAMWTLLSIDKDT